MGFSQKQFDTENEELVDVEDEEEDEELVLRDAPNAPGTLA